MKQLLTLWALLLVGFISHAQTARVQVIHNSPSPGTTSGPVVDIYVNGALLPPLTAVPFRAATSFLDVPADLALTIEVKVSPSQAADPAVATFPIGSLTDGATYVVTAAGVVGDPETPFNLYVNATAQEAAAAPDKVDLAVFHGSPDAPAVDVDARTVGNLIGGLAFGDYQGYLSVDPGLYYLDIRPAGNPAIVATFAADLNGLAGGAATVFASGFLGDTPSFGLFAALPDGTVIELPASPVARLQLIHNSPDPVVDVYVNGEALLTDFAFRNASPFIFAPAETPLDIAVVPAGGNPATDNVYTGGPITLTNGQTYVAVAAGVVGNSFFPFTLQILADAREAGSENDKVDFTLLHSSPGAPAVDVDVFGVVTATLATGLTYGNFTPYFTVPGAPYFVSINVPSLGLSIPFYVDLQGLEGGSATVFASGLVGGNPGFGIFAALADGTVVEFPIINEFASANIIHNSPSPGAEEVDIYLNGGLAVDDFAFRTATGFIDLPAGIPLTISIAPSNSLSVDDAIATFDYPAGLEADESYVIIAAGLVGDLDTPFDLFVNTAQQEATATDKVDISVFHGSPNAPAVDVDARLVGNLISNLSFGEFQGYLPVDPDLYYLDIRPTGDPTIVATFAADLNGLAGEAITVFASGLLGDTPAFGLFAALADGTVVELPSSPVARLQLIHNSPDPVVDVYVNGEALLTDFAFRNASPFIFAPAETPLDIAVVPAGGNPATDNVYTGGPITLTNGETYVAVAAGIVGNLGFPFTLQILPAAREAGIDMDNVDFTVLHSSPGAPAVDVEAFGVVTGTLVSDLSYGEFSPYISAPAAPYIITISVPSVGAEIPFYVDLQGLEGGAATVFASGLVGGNPGFGIFAALPDGTVVEFPQITEFANVNIIHNSPAAGVEEVDVYINGGLALDDFGFRTATGFLELPAGIPLTISVAPANSASVADAIADFSFPDGLENGENYVITAAGLPGNPTFPFDLQILTGALLEAADADLVSVTVLHSSPGAPAVDVDARAVGNLVENLAYGDYQGYLDLPSETFYLDIRAAGSPDIVATFTAPLGLFEGEALVVFASGLLGGSPGFGLFAADAFGNVYELEAVEISRTQIIHNSPSPVVDIYLGGDLALEGFAFREATPFIFTPANVDVQVTVVPAGGNPATDAVFDAPVVFGQNGQTLVVVATGVAGDPTTPFTLAVFPEGRESSDGGVDVLLYHGSPDAPEVDVIVDGPGIVLFDNTAYGDFSDDYANVPADSYVLGITPADDNSTVLIRYEADLSGLEGGAAVAFASGFFGGGDPGFAVWVALPNGETFALPVITSTVEIANVRGLNAIPNPVSQGQALLVQLDLQNADRMAARLLDANGRVVRDVFQGQVPAGTTGWNIETAGLTPGMYFLNLVTEKGVKTLKIAVTR